MFHYSVIQKDSQSAARLGKMQTMHGMVTTPIFMAVGTQATVKGMTPAQLKEAGVRMVLGNTYHLMLRPGAELIDSLGGLHGFMGWDGPMLTDSGGFQVFSLATLSKKTADGVHFRSHIDGSSHWLDPEQSMKVQGLLGADVAMAFDDCTPYPADRAATQASMALTHAWAERSLAAHNRKDQALFGIVQGGMHLDLRDESTEFITGLPFHGFAIGGLSVGEPKHLMHAVLKHTTPRLPEDKPRYLMGVGTPADLVNAISAGVDMFDCVMPTRNGRNGQAFTASGTVSIKQHANKINPRPLDDACACYTCSNFTRSYLHHLYKAKEILASVLLTLHNLHFYQDLMARVRAAIKHGDFSEFKQRILAAYGTADLFAEQEEVH